MSEKLVLLFNPNPRGYEGEEDQYCIPPMSLLAISAPLLANGYTVKLVDQTVDKNYKNKILEYVDKALCLGITSMTGHQINGGLEIAKLVRNKNKKLPIVWGGYHPSIFPEETIKSEFVDYVVRGQGEETFLELLEYFNKIKNLESVFGLTYKINGKIYNNPDRGQKNINDFPHINYSLIDINKYITKALGERTFGIRTSQGCPHRCGFCAEVNVTQRRWSGYSADRVLNEMKYLVENYNIDCFMIYDPNFFVDKKRVKDILRGIIENNWNIKLGNINGRTEQLLKLDDEIWQLLKKAGCNDILIGAEAGSDHMLTYITKDTDVENTVDIKKLFHKYDIQPFVSLILGFPRSKDMKKSIKEEFNDLMNLIDRINKIDYKNHIRIWLYMPYAGTSLYENAITCTNLKMPNNLEDWSLCNLTEINVPWIPKRYKLIVNQLNNFIFPYTAEQFSHNWKNKKLGIKNRIKVAGHKFFHKTALFRLKNRFFYFPIEYKMLSFVKRKKYAQKF